MFWLFLGFLASPSLPRCPWPISEVMQISEKTLTARWGTNLEVLKVLGDFELLGLPFLVLNWCYDGLELVGEGSRDHMVFLLAWIL